MQVINLYAITHVVTDYITDLHYFTRVFIYCKVLLSFSNVNYVITRKVKA